MIINELYYVNTNEIPGELSCKNVTSLHMKITYLYTCKDQCCYGYIINCAFRSQSEMVWYFSVIYRINGTLFSHVEI